MSGMTVAGYLKQRLEELGLEQLFGVAGNYTAPFLDTILEDEKSPISIVGTPNELIAGYACDGYARLKGIGAVAVTYGVGAFSLLNAVAGAAVEQVPMVVINGAPTNKEYQNTRSTGLLYSHMMTDPYCNLDVYRRVVVTSERIINAGEAPYQIDGALTACVTHGLPVYLEVLEDVWRAPCPVPAGALPRAQSSVTAPGTQAAVNATLAMIKAFGKPLFWAGVEIQRQGLQDAFLSLVDRSEFSFTTSLMGKSVVSEKHPGFLGVYSPSSPDAMKQLVGGAGCLVGIGAWTTGKDTGNQDILSDSVSLAQHGGVAVGPRFYPSVPLGDYITALTEALDPRTLSVEAYKPARFAMASLLRAKQDPAVTFDTFFNTLNGWLRDDHAVVSDAGFPLIGAQNLTIPSPNGFVAQASWLAIGYSTAAAIGVKFAEPDKRVVVVVGDGAFQETCQAVSSHHYLGQDTVVFVLANGIYGIEQKLVNPNPFRTPPADYPDPLQNTVYPYNDLHAWEYEKLTEAFGGEGRRVRTVHDLAEVLAEIDATPNSNFVVHVEIPKVDTPAALKHGLANPGEDETENAQWPPALLF
jgi:indolepyruvate decarboxylase